MTSQGKKLGWSTGLLANGLLTTRGSNRNVSYDVDQQASWLYAEHGLQLDGLSSPSFHGIILLWDVG